MIDNPYEPPIEPQAPRRILTYWTVFLTLSVLAFLLFWSVVIASMINLFSSKGSGS